MEMNKSVKKVLKRVLPNTLLNKRKDDLIKKKIKAWENAGSPLPGPHAVKQATIAEYQKRYGYTTLVETGTFKGDMVEAQKTRFKKIISIELGADLYEKAKKRFRNDKHVLIVQGDSGAVLPQVLKNINEPAIFWLDGHYSEGITAQGNKDCPIFEEFDAIFNGKKMDHILLIDDARCFIGKGDYPTIEELTKYIKSKDARYTIEVKNDITRCVIG